LPSSAAASLTRQFSEAFLGCSLATLFAFQLIGKIDHALLLWPVTGTALAIVLPYWRQGRKRRVGLLAFSALGFLLSALILGMPVALALTLAGLTMLDVVVGIAILGPNIRTFDDLKRQSNIFRFLAAAATAPFLSGILGAYPVAAFLRQSPFETAQMNVLANSLGMAIVIPSILLFRTFSLARIANIRWTDTRWTGARRIGAAVLFLATSVAVFWQDTHPFLFLILPPMILFLLFTGLEGAVLTSISLTVIGWILTSHGHGPILLARGDTRLEHLLTLQGFLWVCHALALLIGAVLDERKRAERATKEAQSIYQVLLQNADDLIVLSSFDGAQRYVSPAVTRLTGWTQEEYLALDRFSTIHPEDLEAARTLLSQLSAGRSDDIVRYRIATKSRGWKWVEAVVRVYGIAGEPIAGYVGTVRDISGFKEAEETWHLERHRMASLANTDALTGVLNRRGFDERMRMLTATPRGKIALLMVDLDYFKQYNDTFGHQAGDECLIRLAQLLQNHALRRGDITARLGGEEFAVVLLGVEADIAQTLATRMLDALYKLNLPHPRSSFGKVTMSIGVACYDGTSEVDPDLLYQQADLALYESKRRRNSVSVYPAATS
jgi:diguanylate cyclase (GGDEF)-like protein/PAS domain S-box-containing protein